LQGDGDFAALPVTQPLSGEKALTILRDTE
jgi:hypothetical protein